MIHTMKQFLTSLFHTLSSVSNFTFWCSISELASGDLEKFIPVTIPGPSTSMEDLDTKLEGSRPPSSSHTSLSEDVLSPPSQYYSEEEDEEEESDQDDQADSDLEVN